MPRVGVLVLLRVVLGMRTGNSRVRRVSPRPVYVFVPTARVVRARVWVQVIDGSCTKLAVLRVPVTSAAHLRYESHSQSSDTARRVRTRKTNECSICC